MNEPEALLAPAPAPEVRIAVIGGGPAGLMAADVLAGEGYEVQLFDAMTSVGRKFLLAGRGGLNVTHAEALPAFMSRYGGCHGELRNAIAEFDNEAVRRWALALGQDTFIGSSQRVFPVGMKASPLLRAWLKRLQGAHGRKPVRFYTKHRWIGWQQGEWAFATPDGIKHFRFDAVVLALGGGSWARLGSDGAWVPLLESRGVSVSPLVASNCGFDVQRKWSDHFRLRYAGQPLKSVVLTVLSAPGADPKKALFRRKGEFVATDTGFEGSLIYAASAAVRAQISENASAHILVDLLPDHSLDRVLLEVARPRGSRTLSTHLKSRLGLEGIKAGLLYEVLGPETLRNERLLAMAIKSLPLVLGASRPLDEAISSAGGVKWDSLDEQGSLKGLPGVFCAGEMLDWDAPTGGYLLTACLALGRKAGNDVHRHLEAQFRSSRAS
jgi:uncharacterized flavoprotein (TIGR03862 family)